MGLTYKGRPFRAKDLMKDLEADILAQVKDEFRERFSAIRDPATGEFPTVIVHGDALDDIRLSIEGSPALLALVQERMSLEERDAATFTSRRDGPPKVFLSYSFEDAELAERIARRLTAGGVQTWWAGWEMRSGDSLRRKIDEGLGDCTHFLVLLTPGALLKPWVQQEMDAGLVRRIAGHAQFIPLRHRLMARELPPLLSGMVSPEVDDARFDEAVRDLVNDIHGVSRKPPLGAPPTSIALPTTGYSQTATAIAKVFVEETTDAMFGQTQKSINQLAEAIGVSEDDVTDALHELRDFVNFSFERVMPKAVLYAVFDKFFTDWSPEEDALRLATDIVNDPAMPHDTEAVAARYGWKPRRMNPALSYLLERKLIRDYQVIASKYVTFRIVKTDATRRFVKSRS